MQQQQQQQQKQKRRSIIVTGCAGFIGSNFVRYWQDKYKEDYIYGIDKFTYAARMANLKGVDVTRFSLIRQDIKDITLEKLEAMAPSIVFNFAANSHVDNSIENAFPFVDDNVGSTVAFLETCRRYNDKLDQQATELNDTPVQFLFQHISTDEVYGALRKDDTESFKETNQYQPNSPYSASKAASDHFVRAYSKTYGLPVVITHCSNNYGARQHPEKLIPKVIHCCMTGKPIPVYGQGEQIRDWIHVLDHCSALDLIAERHLGGYTGYKVYNIGAGEEISNLELVIKICELCNDYVADRNCRDLITFVEDRLGHDFRYSVDSSLVRALGWKPEWTFEDGIKDTVRWYMEELI